MPQVLSDDIQLETRVSPIVRKSKESIEGMYDGEYTGQEINEYNLLRCGYVLMEKESRKDGRRMKHYIRTLGGRLYQVWISIE